MRNLFLSGILLFVFASSTSAQTNKELEKRYVNETIYRFGGGFMKGTERLRFGDLRNEFSTSSVGLGLYEQSRTYRTTSLVLRSLSIVASLATASIAAKNGNLNTLYIGLGAQFVLMTTGAYYYSLSNEQLDRALWQRNKDVLFPPK